MSDLSALHDMTLFVEVARTKNFSAAGRRLGVPAATLSRRIAAMEREFGVRLFDRTTRRVELTEAGARYFERCAHLADEARLAQESLRETATRPGGHLRVSMPVDLGVYMVGPLLPEFTRQFPGITLDLDLSSRHADHVDVAIRLTPDLARDALASGRLVRVLPSWSVASLPVHAVTSSRLQPARVKAFVAFLADRLGG